MSDVDVLKQQITVQGNVLESLKLLTGIVVGLQGDVRELREQVAALKAKPIKRAWWNMKWGVVQ